MAQLFNAISQFLQLADLFLKQPSMLVPEFTYFELLAGFLYIICVIALWRKVLMIE